LGSDWGRIDFAGSVLGVSILVNLVGAPPNLNVVSEVFFSSFSDSDIASGSLSVDKGAMDLFSSSFLASSSAFALAAIAAAVAGLVCAGLPAASPAPAVAELALEATFCCCLSLASIASAEDFAKTIPYEGCVDYFLFDTKGKSVGGNGVKFDWSVLGSYTGKTPFLLSGGIGSDDAQEIKTLLHPLLAGIDLNSKFEIEPGLKDINKLSSFLKQLKS
jgi:hypothetical protein